MTTHWLQTVAGVGRSSKAAVPLSNASTIRPTARAWANGDWGLRWPRWRGEFLMLEDFDRTARMLEACDHVTCVTAWWR